MNDDTTPIDCPNDRRAEVLAALYNRSSPAGMGWLRAVAGEMTAEDAAKEIEAGDDMNRSSPGFRPQHEGRIDFDYLRGRPLKICFTDGKIGGLWLYDRDNGGKGTAARIIAEVLSKPKP